MAGANDNASGGHAAAMPVVDLPHLVFTAADRNIPSAFMRFFRIQALDVPSLQYVSVLLQLYLFPASVLSNRQ